MNELGAFFSRVTLPCEIIVTYHHVFNGIESFLRDKKRLDTAQYVIFLDDNESNAKTIGSFSLLSLRQTDDKSGPYFRFRITSVDRMQKQGFSFELNNTCAKENEDTKALNEWISGVFSQAVGQTVIVKL